MHARPPAMAVARIQAMVERDIADLVPTLEKIADERLAKVKVDLAKRGEAEAKSLAELVGSAAQAHRQSQRRVRSQSTAAAGYRR